MSDTTASERRAAGRRLRIYLNDHLAATTAGVRLARRCHAHNPSGQLGAFLERLVADLEGDRRALADVMERLGVRVDRVKQVGVVAGERLGALKLNGQLTGYSDLSRLEELETLVALVAVQECLWAALAGLAADDARLQAAAPDQRAAASAARRQALDGHRAAAARRALQGSV